MRNDYFLSNFKKQLLLFLFMVGSLTASAQENGILLENSRTHKTHFYPENLRIKVKTTDGKKYIGQYTIADENTIVIDGTSIPLDSIVKIKKRSEIGSILRPILITFGTLCLTGAVVGALAGGYGYIATVGLLPPGAISLLLALNNDHKSENWSYKIVYEYQ